MKFINMNLTPIEFQLSRFSLCTALDHLDNQVYIYKSQLHRTPALGYDLDMEEVNKQNKEHLACRIFTQTCS